MLFKTLATFKVFDSNLVWVCASGSKKQYATSGSMSVLYHGIVVGFDVDGLVNTGSYASVLDLGSNAVFASDQRQVLKLLTKQPGADQSGFDKAFYKEVDVCRRIFAADGHPGKAFVMAANGVIDGTLKGLFFDWHPHTLKSMYIDPLHPEPIDLMLIKRYLKQLLLGVQFLSRLPFCHRDLNVSNILVTADGTLKITDYNMHDGEYVCSRDVRAPEALFRALGGVGKFKFPAQAYKRVRLTYIDSSGQHFGSGFEVWSIATVIAGLSSVRGPEMIFSGISSRGALERIVQVIGINTISTDMRLLWNFYFPKVVPNCTNTLSWHVLNCDGLADYLGSLLILDPDKRPDVDAALDHPFLNSPSGR